MDDDEPANIYMLYPPAADKHSYAAMISEYISGDKKVAFSADEVRRYAKDKQAWKRTIAAVPNKLVR